MLVAYTLEILPYKIRAKGFAMMVSWVYQESAIVLINIYQNFTVYVTTIFNQFANPIAIERLGWWYYIV